MEPKHAKTGAIEWYKKGWQWFMVNPLVWVLLIIAYFLVLMALQLLPFVGSLIGAILWPGLSAGLLVAAKKSSENVPISVNDLFSALTASKHRLGLLHLGMISLVVALLSGLVIFKIGGEQLMQVLNQTNPAEISEDTIQAMQSQFPMMMWIMLIISAITAVFFMYAVPLVAFHGVPAFTAIKSSIWTTVVNLFPLTLFGLLYLGFAILASLPLMLGFLILMPVTICAWYASYVDIFEQVDNNDMTTTV